ncbi:MAG: hypothetical protein Q7K34_02715 [archaeon]|nr:hypothetical protein [archaeon]
MGVETVFLVVLVVALGIGNVLLSLFFEEKPGVFAQKPKNVTNTKDFDSTSISVQPGLENVSANQKFLLISRRLADIDAKVHKLDNFRGNTQVELKGLMEILAELQDKNLTVRAKKFQKSEPELSTHEMHEIIYRSR